MDIHLPGEDGLEIATRLAVLCPVCSLIIITGSDLAEYRLAALQAGATHFVSKGDETLVDILKIVQGSMVPPQADA
jgi:DNA-binding NarL/FixJ family response regulator